jgi:hypothetical protein
MQLSKNYFGRNVRYAVAFLSAFGFAAFSTLPIMEQA